jgi:heme/copper-type cytochrome/quinol oxidase subunit 2
LGGVGDMVDVSKLRDFLEYEEIFFKSTRAKFEEEFLLILNTMALFALIYLFIVVVIVWVTVYIWYYQKKLHTKLEKVEESMALCIIEQ